jgi:hypothetical protein
MSLWPTDELDRLRTLLADAEALIVRQRGARKAAEAERDALRQQVAELEPKAKRLDELMADADCCSALAERDALRALLKEARAAMEAMSFGEPVPGSWRDRVDDALAQREQSK